MTFFTYRIKVELDTMCTLLQCVYMKYTWFALSNQDEY
jgi:hypothetical protein